MAKIARRYYSLVKADKQADLYIFGDIVSWEWLESDISSYTLAKEIEALGEDIATINVYINSYGGEVKEGLAIYNALRRHKAKVKTVCDGFACSAASVVFMAGDERVMPTTSLLMIHNAWMLTAGNSDQLRKDADDLETINEATMQAYLTHVNITEDELKALMDAETWLNAADAVAKGFATSITEDKAGNKAAASVREKLVKMVLNNENIKPEDEPVFEPEPIPEDNKSEKLANLLSTLFVIEKGDPK